MKRSFLLSIVCLFSIIIVAQVNAADKITGPWLIVIAPCEAGKGGADSNELDQLEAAGGRSEADVAARGAVPGEAVGDLAWVKAELPAEGGDNIQDMINAGKADWGGGWADLPDGIEDHSFYGLICLVSTTDQPGVIGRAGSDDAVRVWLNGEVVHTNSVNRGASDFQDEFTVDLRQGNNLLLIKSSERGGGWSVFVGFEAEFSTSLAVSPGAITPLEKLSTTWGAIKGLR
jgi:hypothetical protein